MARKTNNPGTIILLAKDGMKIIGLVGLYRENLHDKKAEVWGMYVSGFYRGKGIARQLMEKLFDIAIGNGLQRLSLMVNPSQLAAQKLYTSLGFIRVENKRLELGDEKEYDLLVMEKQLH